MDSSTINNQTVVIDDGQNIVSGTVTYTVSIERATEGLSRLIRAVASIAAAVTAA